MADARPIPVRATDPEAGTNPIITSVCDYWHSLNAGRPPRRKAFDFMAVYKAAPYLLMAERVAPLTYRFIYCGTFVADNFPLDLTGKTFGRDTARMSRVKWPTFFTEVLDTPCIRYGREPVDWPNDEYADILYGVFPLADDADQPALAVACLVFLLKSPYVQVR